MKSMLVGVLSQVWQLDSSWVMNEFMMGPGQRLQQAVQPPEDNERYAIQSGTPKEDATMKTADAVVNTVTGGQHFSREEREKAGPWSITRSGE
jgi:hypothetical protein